jgi:polysaccharide biosynthesis transport protein
MSNDEGALEYALRVLRRRKVVVLVALVSVPLAAFLFSSAKTKQYTASATLLFESSNEAGLSEASREAATNEALAALPAVAVKAAKQLGPGASLGEVLGSVEVGAASEMANLTTISATNPSPERAAEIANAYSHAYIAFRRESDQAQLKKSIAVIEDRLEGLTPAEVESSKGELLRERLDQLEVEEALQTGKTSLVQEAGPPSSPSSPRTSRNVIIGLIVGLLLGLALAAVIERLDRRVRSVDELEKLFGLSLIARIPDSKVFKRLSPEQMLATDEAEAFRSLRTNLRYLNINRELDSILIASPEPSDGKSTVARGLAATMVETGDSVALVEADLRKVSAFHNGGHGLASVLAGEDLDQALVETPIAVSGQSEPRILSVLPAGSIPPNPSELLESERMKEILDELTRRFGTVVVDSPALGVVSDAMALVPHVSAILAVGGIGRTTREGAKGFVDQLALSGSRPLGLIATFTPASRGQYSYYRRQPRALLRR